jgi:hypothetical protein
MSKVEQDILGRRDLNTDLAIKDIEYDPKGQPNSKNAEDRAVREGLDIRFPADNELFIDIDNEHSYLMFEKQIDIVKKHVGLKCTTVTTVTPSMHGLPGRHIVVTLSRNVTELERICLQACMGSDRVRELLGFIQNVNKDPHPTLFLEAKVKLLTGDVA